MLLLTSTSAFGPSSDTPAVQIAPGVYMPWVQLGTCTDCTPKTGICCGKATQMKAVCVCAGAGVCVCVCFCLRVCRKYTHARGLLFSSIAILAITQGNITDVTISWDPNKQTPPTLRLALQERTLKHHYQSGSAYKALGLPASLQSTRS